MRKEVKASKKYWFVWDEELINHCAFDAFLFNDPAHLALQPCKNRHSYYLIKKHDEVIHARCTFFLENGVAYSPYKGSFGSIEFSDKVFFELLEEYWDLLEADLRSKGVKEFFIKNYPVCYNPPHAQMLSFLYSTKGFGIKTQELNFHIEVDEVEFERKVHENERRKLKASLSAGFTIERKSIIDADQFYSFFVNSRKERGIPVTMDKNLLFNTLSKFPDNYIIFSCLKDNQIVATCLTVIINESIIYTFYLSDNSEYKSYSPLVLIHKEVFNYAKKNNFTMLDFGIGSAEGNTNSGLIRFKEKVGGAYDLKLIYQKTAGLEN